MITIDKWFFKSVIHLPRRIYFETIETIVYEIPYNKISI